MFQNKLILSLLILELITTTIVTNHIFPKTCEKFLEASRDFDNLTSLKLVKEPHVPPEYMPKACLKKLTKLKKLEILSINYYRLDDTSICLILRNKPNLKEFSVGQNLLTTFNLACLNSTINLERLVINNNPNVKLTGTSETTKNINNFEAKGNHFKEFPLDDNWPNLEKITVNSNDELDWHTFNPQKFPRLQLVNDELLNVFLQRHIILPTKVDQDDQITTTTNTLITSPLIANTTHETNSTVHANGLTLMEILIFGVCVTSLVILAFFGLRRILNKRRNTTTQEENAEVGLIVRFINNRQPIQSKP